MNWKTIADSEEAKAEAHRLLDDCFANWGGCTVEFTKIHLGKMTDTQRGAIHKWCSLCAQVMTEAGLDMRKVLKEEVDIPWTKESVKEYMYKPVLLASSQKESTEDMDTVEPSKIVDIISRHMAQKFGVTLPPFPTRYGA